MNVKINHELKTITPNASLDTLLDELNIAKQGIAVAINNIIVTKSAWQKTVLKENDNVTIIQATQGG